MIRAKETYPFGLSYQRQLVAGMFRDREILGSHRRVLRPSLFEDPLLRDLSGLILKFFDKYKKAPTANAVVELIGDYLKERPDEVAILDLMEELLREDLTDLPDVKEKAVNFAVRQSCIAAARRTYELLKNDRDLDTIPGLFQEALAVGKSDDDLGLDYLRDYGRFSRPFDSSAFPTGLPTLDRWLRGGMSPGEVTVLLAATGVGKSWAMVNLAKASLLWGSWAGGAIPHSKAPKSVVWLTGEISEDKVAERFDQVLFLKNRGQGVSSEIERMLYELQWRAKNNLRVKKFSAYKWTTMDVRSYLSRLESEGIITRGSAKEDKPGNFLLVCDYAKLLRPTRASKGGKHEEIQETYLDFKNISEEWWVPGLTGIQTGREGFDKAHVTPKDFAGSYDVATDMDTIMALCQTLQEARLVPSEKRLLICKARGGGETGRELVVTEDKECRAWCEKGEAPEEKEERFAKRQGQEAMDAAHNYLQGRKK